jgi:transcriptional regulator GlxA family with amidase domain
MRELPVEPTNIDILILPDTNLILLASVIEPLRGANRISGNNLYRWRLYSPDGQPVMTTSGIPIPVEGAFPPKDQTAPLFVLSAYYWQRHASRQLKMQLSQSARVRPYIAGIESGVWLMAEASLLNGFSATAHWEDFDDFSSAYPQIEAVRSRYVISGKRITTGGSLPTLDLMLELIRRHHGYSLALEVSRLFNYLPKEATGSPGAAPLAPSERSIDARVISAIHLMEDHIETPLTMERLARRCGVTPRHLQALFKTDIGVVPHVHYLALRLNAARRQVGETRLPLTEIANSCGFNSASAFSRSYRQHFGESPRETRKRTG